MYKVSGITLRRAGIRSPWQKKIWRSRIWRRRSKSSRSTRNMRRQKSMHWDLTRKGSTFTPIGPSCPPRGWSGAGLGVGMLRGVGDSLTWKWKTFLVSKFQSLKVSIKVLKFQSFNVSKTQSFKVPKFQSFKLSKCQNVKISNLWITICQNVWGTHFQTAHNSKFSNLQK